MSEIIHNVVIIGTGSVALHLARAFSTRGVNVVQIYGRNLKSAKEIAKEVNAGYVSKTEAIDPDSDLYVVALNEKVIREVLEKIPRNNKLLVHTSGSVEMEILNDYSDNIGVFYPLQTFSKHDDISFDDIPICVEANSMRNLEIIKELALSLSGDVRVISSEDRRIIHLAAVFACNFPNLMFTIAENILKDHNIGFEILLPLIKRTTEKVYKAMPSKLQTGPAHREDKNTLYKHLELLNDNPGYKEIYELLSEEIIKAKAQR